MIDTSSSLEQNIINRTIAWFILLSGVAFILSGFMLSLNVTFCGVTRLLLGVAPALAGGYYAYCLEAWRYEAHLQPDVLRKRCLSLYALALVFGSVVYALACLPQKHNAYFSAMSYYSETICSFML